MRFTKKTEYGIVSMVFMARHEDQKYFSLKEIASSEHYPTPYIEKILQALRKAELVKTHQGKMGGYALAKKPSEITLRMIIDALEGSTFDVFCAPETREGIVCTHFCLCGVKPVWRKTKQILDEFYGAITLEMMTKDEIEVRKLLAA